MTKRVPQNCEESDSKRMKPPSISNSSVAPPPILGNINDLMGGEEKMTEAHVWRRMRSSRKIKLTEEEKQLLVDEFNKSKDLNLDLPDPSPRTLSEEERSKMINKSMEMAKTTLEEVKKRLKDIADEQNENKENGRSS